MRLFRSSLVVLAAVVGAGGLPTAAAELLTRVPNTSLQLPVVPGSSTFAYGFTNALGALTFTNPVCLASPPGETNRLFVLEKRGRVIVITNLAAPTRTVFMDIADRVLTSDHIYAEDGLLGMAFHPGHATNGYFYLYYVGWTNAARHDVLSRFEAAPGYPNQGLATSELPLIVQPDFDFGHNGGDLHFGPDGYLYLSLGDGGVELDFAITNGQRIGRHFFSGIVRLDVDKRPGSLPRNPHPSASTNYAIPPDNPFVGATQFNGLPVSPAEVRTEFWAVGLRNPWRMSFDPVTGQLYCGDVGGNFEEINLISKGGNYGWPYWCGFDLYPSLPPGTIPAEATPDHTPPLLARPWRSPYLAAIGGVVYRGQRMPELHGAYIYGYWGGEIQALRHSGTNVTESWQLAWLPTVTAFGVDPANGDILVANAGTGPDATIDRLVRLPGGQPLPPTLADTGAFTNLTTLTPHTGIVPYDINVPFWSDAARKTRWFSIPNPGLTMNFAREDNWSFPTGTVWIKHFELELTNGMPTSSRRLETRFLVKNDAGVYGATYRWGDSLTNAALVPEDGLDETFVVNFGGGMLRTQVWRYPSQVECLACHTAVAGHALGFNTAQLNREFDYGDGITNQLAALGQAGYFSVPLTNRHTLPALSHPADDAVSLEHRVRSYLAANCVSCHQPAGPARSYWDARVSTPGPRAGLVKGPLYNNFGNPTHRVIAPGSISNSTLLRRVAESGPDHMPPLATAVINTQAVQLLSAWITNELAGHQTFAEWQTIYFGATNVPWAAPLADADGDRSANYLEYLTRTNPTNGLDAWRIFVRFSNRMPVVEFAQIANRGFEVQAAADLAGGSWTPLDVPANAPFFSVSNRPAAVADTGTEGNRRYYRVRVFEP